LSGDSIVIDALRISAATFALIVAVSVPAFAAGEPCVFQADCADGNVCNGIEFCNQGFCEDSAPIPCDDGDPCTLDFCDAAVGCGHSEELCATDCTGLSDGTRCVDGSVCTLGDVCSGGACQPGAAPICPDADGCTAASCDPRFGCTYSEEFVEGPCVPTCDGTVADFTPCPGDDDICTRDACLPSADFGLDFCIDALLFLRQCGDSDACNGAEWCSPLLGCQAGPPLVCDDGDICNGIESCDAGTGCLPGAPQLPDGSTCDDTAVCTVDDECTSGACAGRALTPADCDDANPATDDFCLESFGCLSCPPVDRARAKIKFAKPGKIDGRLKVAGEATTAGGVTLSPGTEVLTVVVELDGATFFRAELPAGSLEEKKPGRFGFKDKTGLLAGGLRSVKLKELSGGRYKIRANTVKSAFDQLAATSVKVTLPVGNDCFSATPPCVTAGGGRVLSCKG
jgi:hypothetical protein